MRALIESRLVVAAALAAATIACGDVPAPTAPDPTAIAISERATTPGAAAARVAVVGIIEEVRGSTLLVRQSGPTVPQGTPSGRVDLPLGEVGDLIEVRTAAATQIFVGGTAVAIDALAPGMRIVAAGEGIGVTLMATKVSDLAVMMAPTDAMRAALAGVLDTTTRVERALVPVPPMAAAALCASQDFDYGSDVDEFQGCWGGPTVTGSYDNPDVPVSCGILGCFILERVSYQFSLGGWSFAFPYRFSAVGDLVYHVPGTVTLGLEALPATTGAFTFAGGLGVDFGFTFRFCWIVGGCDDLGTYHISPYSTAHQATGAPPFSGETMSIAEVGCPSIPVIPFLPGLDILGLGLCEDLSFAGDPFKTAIWGGNTWPPVGDDLAFDGATKPFTMRPTARTASVTFDEFEYIPTLKMGFYFRVKVLGLKLFETPSIPISDGPFEAITTPFPLPGSVFSANVPQPTSRTIVLEVAKAPTTLTMVSPSALEEGMPVRMRLAEAYDDSPIAGATVTFTATGEGAVLSSTGITGADGAVAFTLANGEYVVSASFGGSDVYLPSQSGEREVTVYQPTTFVVWGANAGGMQAGARYLFWGSQWWKAITAGDVRGISSFKGFATQRNADAWMNEPGSSAPPPAKVGRLIGVIVSTSVSGRGSWAEGDIADWVILRVEDPAGYAPAAGHAAYGVMRRRIADPPQ